MPGAILDIWYLQPGADAKTVISSEVPIGRMLDKGPYFSLSTYAADSNLATYKNKSLALRWSGFMKISEAGRQLVIMEVKLDKLEYFKWNRSSFILEVDSNQVISLEEISPRSDNLFVTGTATLDLEPGYYPFKLYFFPQKDFAPSVVSRK